MGKIKFFIFIFVLIFGAAAFPSAARAETLEPPGSLAAKSAVLIDADSGVVIFEKEMDERLYPASITKLMTVLLTLEYTDGFYEDRVLFSREAVYSLPSDSSGIAMDEGESLTMEQALYAIMLASANEVANAVAEHIAGSIGAFADMMNARAAELGAKNTHFANPHGYHDDNHYTSARDMALIMRECVKHPFFITLISTEYYEIPPTERMDETRVMTNSNRMIRESDYYNPDVVGGKTGFTTPAGHTLAVYAERGGMKIISVVMKSERNIMYEDTEKLLEYGFGMYGDVALLDKDDRRFNLSVPVTQVYRGRVIRLGRARVSPSGGLSAYLPVNVDLNGLTYDVSLPETLAAPVGKGQAAGKVTIGANGFVFGAVALVTQNEIKKIEAPPSGGEKKGAAFREAALVILSRAKTMLSLAAILILPMFLIRWFNILRKRKRKTARAARIRRPLRARPQ